MSGVDEQMKARALMIACPHCGAAPGGLCRPASGRGYERDVPHALRIIASEGRRR